MNSNTKSQCGFTLIELSIVLVIIGLIVGGILAGRDLIKAAEVRATITQVEKFNSAIATFYGKYATLPGDINASAANQFGFAPRGQYTGEGDGNGVLEGVNQNSPGRDYGYVEGAGETVMFWSDLTYANGMNINLIEGSFTTASSTTVPGSPISGTALNNYFPQAKLGGGNYFYVYSGSTYGFGAQQNSVNYVGLSAITNIPTSPCDYCLASSPGLTVSQARAIESKVDDGLPQSGNVTAVYLNYLSGWYGPVWAKGGGGIGAYNGSSGGPTTSAESGSSSTCYDNGGVAGAAQQYSVEINNGADVNCALSFQIKVGD